MKKTIIIFAVALILIAAAVYTINQYNDTAATPAPPSQSETPTDPADAGEEEPKAIDALDFKLKDLNGKEVSLSDYKGKVIYLNFWATWCPPCQHEMPFIQKLHEENKDPDFVILTIDLQESEAVVEKFMAEKKYSMPVILDTEGAVSSMYGIQNIPLSLLIDKDFKIVSAYEGAMESYEMLEQFTGQLKENK